LAQAWQSGSLSGLSSMANGWSLLASRGCDFSKYFAIASGTFLHL